MSDEPKRKGRNFKMRAPRANDRIFQLGYIIGGIRQTGIVSRTEGRFHDQGDWATIVFGYRRESSDD